MSSSSEFQDTLGGRNPVYLEIHYGGCDGARLNKYLEAVGGRHAWC